MMLPPNFTAIASELPDSQCALCDVLCRVKEGRLRRSRLLPNLQQLHERTFSQTLRILQRCLPVAGFQRKIW